MRWPGVMPVPLGYGRESAPIWRCRGSVNPFDGWSYNPVSTPPYTEITRATSRILRGLIERL
jgi:hypothetical protein